jgi:hypothetical protein
LIERAYRFGEALGLQVWTEDEFGPFQAIPRLGTRWRPEGQPACLPHEHIRGGTAKLLTLFRPASGEVRAKGVTACPNAVLHPWLQQELTAILATCPPPVEPLDPETVRRVWESWRVGMSSLLPLPPDPLPPLRVLLVCDNLAGHKTPTFVRWCYRHGILPLYTPLSGSWLNMAESIGRILVRRALDGQHPPDAEVLIDWLEATVRSWNREPTPFEWGGKRAARRQRARARRHAVGGSGAYTRRSIARRHRATSQEKWLHTSQMTH